MYIESSVSMHSSHNAYLVEVIIVKERDVVLQLPMHGVIHLILPFLLQLSHTLIKRQKITLIAVVHLKE